MENLFGKTLTEINEIVQKGGLPGYTGKQIASWLYKKDIRSIDEMSDLSKKARELLQENYTLTQTAPVKVQQSTDGTKKYLFPTFNDKFIEAAYIPESRRNTLCVSSQVGCKMGCLFCMTGKQGFQGHLPAGEILNQIKQLPEREKLSNIVYMGMGEPFDNIDEVLKSLEILTSEYGFGMSPRRITVSTIGIIPGMRKFLDTTNCHLAVSLHSPFEEDRLKLMPVETVYPVKKVIEVIREYQFDKQRRVSFEYIMFKGINDTPKHVKGLTRLLNGMRCRVNLIRFHTIPRTPLESSDEITINNFKESLNNKGILTTVRTSRGVDIDAACGMLSTKMLVGKK
jgi:23S rRNA (adenine2503-C2)-methyltransferase